MPAAALAAMQVVAATEAADTAKAFNNKFLPSGSKSTSQRFEPFFLGQSISLHNMCYRKLPQDPVSRPRDVVLLSETAPASATPQALQSDRNGLARTARHNATEGS
jgi:hypothetical protein